MSDFRYDPFTDGYTATAITGEVHMIPMASPFTIRLREVPLKTTPSTIVAKLRDVLTVAVSSATAGTVTVANGSWFNTGDVLTAGSEQMLITGIATNTLSVTRGYNGTTAATHDAGSVVYGPVWSEVAATPATRQFWPDYSTGADDDAPWNTGTAQCNSVNAGQVLEFAYSGTGTLASVVSAKKFPAWMENHGDGSDGHYISIDGDTIDGFKQYKSFLILPGHTVYVGALPLWLHSQGPVVIAGTLDASGNDGQSNSSAPSNGTGRGGADSGIHVDVEAMSCAAESVTYDFTVNNKLMLAAGKAARGGGAAWKGSWWRGYKVAGANATPPVAAQNMMAIEGDPGSGGPGWSNYLNGGQTLAEAGQAGSGGCVLIACKRFRKAGSINVAAGSNGTNSGALSGGAGAGGGAIRIVAPTVDIPSTGVIDVSGGNGGNANYACTAGAPAAGWYKVFELGAA